MLTRDLSYLVEVTGGKVCLTALQLCARDIEKVLGDPGQLPVAELESQFEAKFGRELPLEPLGFDTVSEMLVAMSDTLSVRGRGIRKVVSVSKSANTAFISSPSRPSSILLPPAGSQPKSSEVAAFSGRGFDMLRMVTPHTVPRSYSGVVQSESRTKVPPCLSLPPSNRYSVPPPTYRPTQPPPMVVSPPQSYSLLTHANIPIASPNSPSTPTTPRTMNYPYPMFPFYATPRGVFGSPMSSSPIPTATFQQHMMQHSPSPLITHTRAPYIVQPISRTNPQVGFYPQQEEEISSSLSSGLTIASSNLVNNNGLCMNWAQHD